MKQPSPTLIGVFVLGALALIVAAILFFGSGTLFKQRFPIVSYFHGSVAGLRVGAPVTFRGVPVGEVKSIGIRVDPDTMRSIIPVHMELVPDIVEVQGLPAATSVNPIPDLVERGLTARLVMQSFVTGQLQVELDFRPDAQASRLGSPSEVPEIPTVPSPFYALAQQLESLDITAIVASLQRAAGSVESIFASPALAKAIEDLPALLADLRGTVKTLEREASGTSATAQRALAESAAALQKTLASVEVLSQNLDKGAASTLDAARVALRSANSAFDSANSLLDPRGETMIQIQRAVDDLAATAARLRSLAERVDRDPAVLLRGR